LANLKWARYSRIVTHEIWEAMWIFWNLLMSQMQYSEGYSWLLGKVASINYDSYVILVILLSKVLESAPDLWEPVYTAKISWIGIAVYRIAKIWEKFVTEFPKDTMEIRNKLPEPFTHHTESIWIRFSRKYPREDWAGRSTIESRPITPTTHPECCVVFLVGYSRFSDYWTFPFLDIRIQSDIRVPKSPGRPGLSSWISDIYGIE
jgi:hypothetical protein